MVARCLLGRLFKRVGHCKRFLRLGLTRAVQFGARVFNDSVGGNKFVRCVRLIRDDRRVRVRDGRAVFLPRRCVVIVRFTSNDLDRFCQAKGLVESSTRATKARDLYFQCRAPGRIQDCVFFRGLLIIDRNCRLGEVHVRQDFVKEAFHCRVIICAGVKEGFQYELCELINCGSVTNAIVRGTSSQAILRQPANRVTRALINTFTVGVTIFRVEWDDAS